MSINITDTNRVGELPPTPILMANKIPHEAGTDLGRATVQELADLIKDYIGTSSSLAFNPTTVTDGGTLPATTSNEWMLVGKGTFNNVGGGEQIICTEELSAITSNGLFWSISVEIPINVELAGIVQNIRSGYVNTVPSEDAVFNALAEKIGDVSDNKIYARTQGSWVEIDLSTSSIEVDDFEYTTGLQQFNLSNTASQILSVSVNGWSTENYTVINSDTILINDVIGTGQEVVIRYLTDLTTGISPYYTKLQTDAIASNKVDKVVGFGLSKNDFTDVLKAKLDSITAIFTTTLKTTYDNTATALTNLLATGSRLITTGEITKLSNITGTNTGDQDLSGLAPKISPVLTGTPTAPTATVGTNTNQIATTAFVLENANNIPQLESNANDLTVWNNGKGNAPTNTSFGEFALKSNTVSSNSFNSAFGHDSLSSNTLGTNNTAVGHKALKSNIAGGSNVAVGSFALSAANAYSNVAIGNASLLKTTGSGNSSIGDNSLSENTTGGFNSAIGDSAGRFISDGITPNAITNNSVFLGGNTKSLAANQTNQIVIGFDTIGAGSNTATLGNSSIVRTVLGGVIQKRTLDTAPSSATDTGVLGEIRVTSTYIYVCIATNIWVRTSLSTW